MKKYLVVLIASTFCAQLSAAGYDYCEVYENPQTHQCRALGPFDVSRSTYDLGLDFNTSPFTSGFDFGVHVSDNFYQFMQGMERYAEEMEEWINFIEFREDEERAEQLNSDLTDNTAYAIIYEAEIAVEYDGKVRWYQHGDIISGTDWNNDGKIDVLNILPQIDYLGERVR